MALPGLPDPGTSPGFSGLDSPPPSPAVETGMSPGPSPSLGSTVAPIPSGGLPPEVLTGMVQAGEGMSKTLDSFAQMAPDLAPEFAAVKEALQRALAHLLQVGAGPTSPTNAGPNFPGGGFERGGTTGV